MDGVRRGLMRGGVFYCFQAAYRGAIDSLKTRNATIKLRRINTFLINPNIF